HFGHPSGGAVVVAVVFSTKLIHGGCSLTISWRFGPPSSTLQSPLQSQCQRGLGSSSPAVGGAISSTRTWYFNCGLLSTAEKTTPTLLMSPRVGALFL